MTTTDCKTAPGVIVSTYADYRLHRHVTDNGAVKWYVTRMYSDMLALETATYDGTTAFYAAQVDIDNDQPDNNDILAAAARALTALLPAPLLPTLAAMTEQEQRDAVGAWARVVIGKGEYTGIIDCTPENGRLVLLRPGAGAAAWSDADKVTPLPELGRAYNPDGTPAPRARTGVPAPRLQELLDSVAGYPADDPVRALGTLMSGLTGLIREALA